MAQSMIWLIFLLFVPSLLINAQYGVQLYNQSCLPTARIYAPQSTFHQNLKIVLENLNDVASTTNYNFHFSSYGQDENKVCALYLCRGDLSPLNCSLCIRNVSVDIVNNCNRTESIRWIEKCMIRYANRNIFFKEEESPSHSDTAVYYGPPSYTPPPAPTPTHTPYTLTQTIDILINETAFSKRAFAKREDNITESLYPIYSLAQCTPDISQKLCHKCLERAFQNLKNSGPLSGESLSYLPSCQLRFDDHNFFEDNSETDPPFSTDQQTPSHKKQKGQRIRTVLIATAAVTALVFIGAGICFTMQAWKPKKLSSAADDEVITVESLQLDFNSIRAATDDFSEDKKLGQGGFGAVYKLFSVFPFS